jgi:predicted dehydrogenase
MIDAAIVGLGRWGQILVRAVQGKSPHIRFTTGTTRTPDKARDFAVEQGFSLAPDYAAVLADPTIRAVVLATPHSRHAEQAIAAAAAGKHVFVEKPFSLDKASAERAVAATATAGVQLCLGHNRRFLPALQHLQRLIGDGVLGTVLHVETNFSAPGGYRYQPGMWRAGADESPAGGMTGLGIHLVDALISLVGPFDSVLAQSRRRVLPIEMDDTTSMLFRFRAGMTGNLTTLTATASFWRIHVFGSKGHAEMRGENQVIVTLIDGEPPEVTDYPFTDSVRAELDCFAEAIGGRAVFPVTPEDAVHGTAVLEAIVASTRSADWTRVG